MPRYNRCMYMAHVRSMSVVVTVCGFVVMFVVQRPLLKFALILCMVWSEHSASCFVWI